MGHLGMTLKICSFIHKRGQRNTLLIFLIITPNTCMQWIDHYTDSSNTTLQLKQHVSNSFYMWPTAMKKTLICSAHATVNFQSFNETLSQAACRNIMINSPAIYSKHQAALTTEYCTHNSYKTEVHYGDGLENHKARL